LRSQHANVERPAWLPPGGQRRVVSGTLGGVLAPGSPFASDASPASRWRPGAGSKLVTADGIRLRYRLVRGLLRSRQPAAGTAIRAREPPAAADWT
jgi:hypothetical protein